MNYLAERLIGLEQKIRTAMVVCIVLIIASILIGSFIGTLISIAGAIFLNIASDELRTELYLQGWRKDL